MDENRWKNPNSFFLALRCMEKQYADTFISHGRLKFNTPKVWEEWSKKGRGDIYEGTLAFCNKRDLKNHNNSQPQPKKGQVK